MHWDSPFLTAYILGLSAILGLVFGSFLNALAYRQVHGGSILRGRSACPQCGHMLSAFDLIPLVSWLLLKGRCRYCGARVSMRYPLTEALAALYFISIVWKYGFSEPLLTLKFIVLGCLLLVAALVDLDTHTISDRLIFPGSVPALLLCGGDFRSCILGAVVISVPLFFLVLLADKLTGKETMGGGDIKLFFMTGAYLGPSLAVLSLICACFAGILLYLVFFRARKDGEEEKEKEEGLAFAPAIGLGAWFCLLAGNEILSWYFGLFS